MDTHIKSLVAAAGRGDEAAMLDPLAVLQEHTRPGALDPIMIYALGTLSVLDSREVVDIDGARLVAALRAHDPVALIVEAKRGTSNDHEHVCVLVQLILDLYAEEGPR